MPSTIETTLVLVFLIAAAYITVHKRKLTLAGALGGVVIGCCMYLGGHFTGLVMLSLFFVLGTLATSWRKAEKQNIKGLQNDPEARNLLQVIANGGVAACCGLLAFLVSENQLLFSVMMASALSTATADTLSSELGTVYGRRFFNITTFKPDRRGLDGVVSLEGLGIGTAGSCLIALLFILGYTSGLASFAVIGIAGTIGNISDSLLGALLERKQLLGNDAVNFFATIIGAIVGGVSYQLIYT